MNIFKFTLGAWKVVCACVCLSFAQLSWGMLPVKSCASLEAYYKVHEHIAYKNIEFWSTKLHKKLEIIDHLPSILTNIIVSIKEELQANQRSIAKIGEPFMEPLAVPKKNLESSISQLTKKLEAISAEIEAITGKKLDLGACDEEIILPTLTEYQDILIKKNCSEISLGSYSTLLGSLPPCFFLPAHVPNTFICAFSLKTENELIDVFVKSNNGVFVITPNVQESFVFESGDSDKDFFKISALPAQTFSLSGSIPSTKIHKISNTPLDLYRHSEQKSFEELNLVEFVNAIVSCVNHPVLEIVYHGNTIRDMCPNCRATLIAYELLAIKNELVPGIDLPDSFLCAIQNEFFRKFEVKPIVTCLISSFIEYDDRKKDVTWLKEVPINLIDPSVKSSEGICSRFLNQFAFSEKVFLDMLRRAISQYKITKTLSTIMSALDSRFSIISKED